MRALPWPYLALLTLGYGLALSYGQLSLQVITALSLLIIGGLAVLQTRNPYLRYAGHGLFVLLALALALHWLPGFHNGRAIAPERLTADAVPFSMYLNLDKPLIGFWLLLVCPWIATRFNWRASLGATLMGLALAGTRPLADAIAAFEAVADATPPVPAVFLSLGKLHDKAGEPALALAAFRRFLEVAPPDHEQRAFASGEVARLTPMTN